MTWSKKPVFSSPLTSHNLHRIAWLLAGAGRCEWMKRKIAGEKWQCNGLGARYAAERESFDAGRSDDLELLRIY
jgi:hypothetical protein